MADGDRIEFYESLVEELIERYTLFYQDLKNLFGKKPFGWVKMTNLQKLSWLEEITQDDPRIMGLYEQVGFGRLMDLLQEKDKLVDRYKIPEFGPESVSGDAAVDRDQRLLRQYIKSIMYPQKGEQVEENARDNGNSSR